jgi:hypothetical protein
MPSTRKPVSPRRLAANRANAERSTGPRTPEGKARSAQNARKHGFRASTFAVVRLEELDEIARLKADLVAAYQPVNSQELFALERVALAQQALLRAARLEAGLFTTSLNETCDPDGHAWIYMNRAVVGGDVEITRAQNRNFLLGAGFHQFARESNSFSLLLRYQAQAERLYRRAIEDFERLKKLRAELPNEPIQPDEPEGKEDPSAPSQTNPETVPGMPAGPRPMPSPERDVTLMRAAPASKQTGQSKHSGQDLSQGKLPGYAVSGRQDLSHVKVARLRPSLPSAPPKPPAHTQASRCRRRSLPSTQSGQDLSHVKVARLCRGDFAGRGRARSCANG